jgi:type IV secretion system protein VirB11
MRPGERPFRVYLAPIAADLTDPAVTEIVINRPGEVGIERAGKWTFRDVPAFTYDRLDQMGILAGFMSGHDFDGEHPIAYASLPDGQRFTIARPPVTASGIISVTIRVPSPMVRSVADDDFPALLQAANRDSGRPSAADQELIALYRSGDWEPFFRMCVKAHKTIVATGLVGSGKTTFLKRLQQEIPLDERVITIEDSDEFGVLPQRNRVALFYGAAGVTAEQAVQLSLRQRPDRVAMQELRGGEAFAYIRALLAGFSGGLTTFHAQRGEAEAFDALAVMVKTHPSGREIPDDKLNQLLRGLIDVIVWCERRDGQFSVPYVWFWAVDEADRLAAQGEAA